MLLPALVAHLKPLTNRARGMHFISFLQRVTCPLTCFSFSVISRAQIASISDIPLNRDLVADKETFTFGHWDNPCGGCPGEDRQQQAFR